MRRAGVQLLRVPLSSRGHPLESRCEIVELAEEIARGVRERIPLGVHPDHRQRVPGEHLLNLLTPRIPKAEARTAVGESPDSQAQVVGDGADIHLVSAVGQYLLSSLGDQIGERAHRVELTGREQIRPLRKAVVGGSDGPRVERKTAERQIVGRLNQRSPHMGIV